LIFFYSHRRNHHICDHNSTQPWKWNFQFKTNLNESEKVEKLSIQFKPFDRIVPKFGKFFSSLKSLNIGFQGIKYIEAEDFEDLEKLEHLSLHWNPLKFLMENVFEKLINLKILDLRFCQLRSLPPKIFQPLRKLEDISLYRNQLRHLDKELFSYNLDLKNIHLDDNQLRKIDVDFTKLTNIEEIWIGNNECINLSFHESGHWGSKTLLRDFQSIITEHCQN
jgi:Leucine-rich repeat (LRR) protein